MSDQINDEDARKLDTGLLPVSFFDLLHEIARTAQFTAGGKKYMGSKFLYPYYGGKKQPDEYSIGPGAVAPSKFEHHAGEVFLGQSAVIFINTLPCAVTITRPYRDWGYMIGIPHDGKGTANRIPGKTTQNGQDFIGIGAYLNDNASILAGSGAVLYLKPEDSKFKTIAFGYGSSVNGGYGMDAVTDASDISDAEDWYDGGAGGSSMVSGDNFVVAADGVCISASVASYDSMVNNYGAVFTVLIEPN